MAELYNEVIGQFNRYMGHVTTNIGGMNENFKTYDQKGAVYDFVNKNLQHDAILFLNKQLFETPFWLINKPELSKFDNGVVLNRIKALQVSVLGNVLTPSRLARMYDNEAKNGSNAYTVAELFTDIHSGVFNSSKPDAFKRNLQRGYIENLKSLLITDASFSFPGITSAQLASFGLTPINIVLSDIRPMVRAELKKIDAGLPKGGDALTAAHFADLHLRIKDALNPDKALINIQGTLIRAINNNDVLKENSEAGYMNCWPKTPTDN